MPAADAPSAAAALTARTRAPPNTITIPGIKGYVSRRYANNPAAHLSAFVVRTRDGVNSNVSVAMKRPDERIISTLLTGHSSNIVDIEFLNPPPNTQKSTISVLGSCDEDGVVYLWFIDVKKNALAIDIGLRVLRQYSFYSLRKSRSAFYSRIRLAGTAEQGTMVLVPNDGSNVRIINFHCESKPEDPGNLIPLIAPPPATAAIELPPDTETADSAPSVDPSSVATALAGAAIATDDSNEVQNASMDRSIPVYERQHDEDPVEEEGFVDAVDPPAEYTAGAQPIAATHEIHMEYVQTSEPIEHEGRALADDDYGQDGELAEDEVDEDYSEEEGEEYSEEAEEVDSDDVEELDDSSEVEELGHGQVTGFGPTS